MSDHLGISSGNLATGDPSCKRPLEAVSQESGTLAFVLLEVNGLQSKDTQKQKQRNPKPSNLIRQQQE